MTSARFLRVSKSETKMRNRYQAIQRRKEERLESYDWDMESYDRQPISVYDVFEELTGYSSVSCNQPVAKKKEEKRLSRGDTKAMDDFLGSFHISEERNVPE